MLTCEQRPPPVHKYLGQTFAVDARALKVFHTMYWIPSDSTRPGDTEWKEIVHAFEMTGIEPEKLYGGLWHFTMTLPGEYEGESFFVNEPWPKGRVSYPEARRIGRRLTRMFG